MKLDCGCLGLLAPHRANDRLQRDAMDVQFAVRDCVGRQDARELLRDVRQAVCLPGATAQGQVVSANQAAQTVHLGLDVDRELRGLWDINASEHVLGSVYRRDFTCPCPRT